MEPQLNDGDVDDGTLLSSRNVTEGDDLTQLSSRRAEAESDDQTRFSPRYNQGADDDATRISPRRVDIDDDATLLAEHSYGRRAGGQPRAEHVGTPQETVIVSSSARVAYDPAAQGIEELIYEVREPSAQKPPTRAERQGTAVQLTPRARGRRLGLRIGIFLATGSLIILGAIGGIIALLLGI